VVKKLRGSIALPFISVMLSVRVAMFGKVKKMKKEMERSTEGKKKVSSCHRTIPYY